MAPQFTSLNPPQTHTRARCEQRASTAQDCRLSKTACAAAASRTSKKLATEWHLKPLNAKSTAHYSNSNACIYLQYVGKTTLHKQHALRAFVACSKTLADQGGQLEVCRLSTAALSLAKPSTMACESTLANDTLK